VYCGETVGWIKMPLGTEVGLVQATLCYIGSDPAPTTESGTAAPPHFSAHIRCTQTVAHLSNC